MREIKCRALAKVTYNYETYNSQYKIKEDDWVFGYYYRDVLDNEDSCSYFHVDYVRIEYGDHYGDIEVDGKTVGQFTGCINKQDVEIYEGDIVEDSPSYKYLNGEYARGVVVFHYYKFVVSYTHPDGAVFYDELDSSFRVVGNIHQHVYLLESK